MLSVKKFVDFLFISWEKDGKVCEKTIPFFSFNYFSLLFQQFFTIVSTLKFGYLTGKKARFYTVST